MVTPAVALFLQYFEELSRRELLGRRFYGILVKEFLKDTQVDAQAARISGRSASGILVAAHAGLFCGRYSCSCPPKPRQTCTNHLGLRCALECVPTVEHRSTWRASLSGVTPIPNVAESTDNSLLPTELASNANQTFISTLESRPRQLRGRWMGSIRNDRFLTNWVATLTVCMWPNAPIAEPRPTSRYHIADARGNSVNLGEGRAASRASTNWPPRQVLRWVGPQPPTSCGRYLSLVILLP